MPGDRRTSDKRQRKSLLGKRKPVGGSRPVMRPIAKLPDHVFGTFDDTSKLSEDITEIRSNLPFVTPSAEEEALILSEGSFDSPSPIPLPPTLPRISSLSDAQQGMTREEILQATPAIRPDEPLFFDTEVTEIRAVRRWMPDEDDDLDTDPSSEIDTEDVVVPFKIPVWVWYMGLGFVLGAFALGAGVVCLGGINGTYLLLWPSAEDPLIAPPTPNE